MAKNRYLILLAGWLVLEASAGIVLAQETGEVAITLINGAVVKGLVTKCSTNGIEIAVGQNSRTYPWYSLAPGSRFTYDVHYRANTAGYLAGEHASSLTNQPDPLYDPMNPNRRVSVDTNVSPAIATGFDFNAFASLEPINPANVSAFNGVTPPVSSCWALQFGPSAQDVVLFGFPAGDGATLYAVTMNNGQLSTDKATTRKVGEEMLYSFARKTYLSQLSSVAVQLEILWLVSTNDPVRRMVQANVALTRGEQKSTFVLQGIPLGIESGTKPVTPRPMLIEPALDFTIQIENEIPFLVGQARMSRLSLLPKSGMDSKVSVEIADAKGHAVMRQDVPFRSDAVPGSYPLHLDISQLTPGQSYNVSAKCSLGSFFGSVTFADTIVVPDARKP